MYIIAVNALMYTMIVRYTSDMTASKKEHEERIADARNSLAEVINRARYLQEPTFLTNRGKRVAVVASTDFYERALRDQAVVEQLLERAKDPGPDAPPDAKLKARVLREALSAVGPSPF